MKKPVIGVILDSEENGSYSDYSYYALRKHYFDAVIKAGGIPVALVYSTDSIGDYLCIIDGLLLTGGDFDVPPSLYGEVVTSETVVVKPVRTEFECELTKQAMRKNMPILGVCAGEQLLTVILGGTLVQDIPSEVEGCLEHYNADMQMTAHTVIINEGTLLHKIIGATALGVNSHHHQSVKNTGDELMVSAYSSDGVIEAIEAKDKKFCLGVQWHPEFINHPSELAIFEAFIEACRS